MRSIHHNALASLLALATFTTLVEARWLMTERGPAVAGQSIEIDVVLANDQSAPIKDMLEDRLPAQLLAGARALDVVLEATDAPGERGPDLAPGTFRSRTYRLAVPPQWTGPVRIELAKQGVGIIVAFAEPPGRPGAASTVTAQAPAVTTPPGTPPTSVLAADTDPRAPAVTTHDPMYFIVGTRSDTTAKFQLSFKYRFFDQDSWAAQLFSPLAKLHFGYTQTSIWDIGQDSAPFRDTSYRPSLFYFEPSVWQSQDGRQRLSLSTGLEHESNGRDAESSRSLNSAFVRPRWRLAFGSDNYLIVQPKLVYYIEKEDNRDLQRYRGYGELNFRLGDADGIEASTTYRKGTSTMGSVEVGLSYPIRRPFFANAGGYLYAQYYNGYGESLLDYNVKRRSQIRFGFAIAR